MRVKSRLWIKFDLSDNDASNFSNNDQTGNTGEQKDNTAEMLSLCVCC